MKFEQIGKSKGSLLLSRLHTHSSWELCYNTKGAGQCTVGEETFPFKAGTVLLCPPGVGHSKTSQDGFEDCFLHFAGCDFAPKVYCIKDDYDKKLGQLMHILHTTYYEERSGAVCDALFEAIMGLVRPMLDSPRQNKYVQKLQQTIIAEFSNPDFRLQQTMEQIPINRDHLRRLFKDALGQTPHGYLLQLRMKNAKRLLSREAELTVAEVAYQSGFYDPLYFSRAFHKYTGVSPSQWA